MISPSASSTKKSRHQSTTSCWWRTSLASISKRTRLSTSGWWIRAASYSLWDYKGLPQIWRTRICRGDCSIFTSMRWVETAHVLIEMTTCCGWQAWQTGSKNMRKSKVNDKWLIINFLVRFTLFRSFLWSLGACWGISLTFHFHPTLPDLVSPLIIHYHRLAHDSLVRHFHFHQLVHPKSNRILPLFLLLFPDRHQSLLIKL